MSTTEHNYPDWVKNRKLANQHFTYLVKKYAPNRTDLLEKLSQDNYIALDYVKYYLGEIDRANNWKVTYSPEDQNLVYDLYFYGGG
ncbi:MAG: hypothetical protein IJ566_02345 [Cardiobacteriaceae bacterium]|nr:hypothetical protein [Cardiobacteriaceae bacterium]